MSRPAALEGIENELRRLMELHTVPGMQLIASREDELVEISLGVVNTTTDVPVTSDTIFQIGSITKVFTATLALQLVDESILELDAPIRHYLPELLPQGSMDGSLPEVSLRQLLSHTSGIECDLIDPAATGDSALEGHVAIIRGAELQYRPGSWHSYSNSAYTLVGRILEEATGVRWNELLRQRLLRPLGMMRACTLPEEAILHSAAVGHVHAPGSPAQRTPVWGIPRAAYPAGGIVCSARELLAFIKMHCSGGTAEDGSRLLSAESSAAMQEEQCRLAVPTGYVDAWGLGWARYGGLGQGSFGHAGGTVGQLSWAFVSPDREGVLIVLTNGLGGARLVSDILQSEITSLVGISPPESYGPDCPDPRRIRDTLPTNALKPGRYRRYGLDIEIEQRPSGPTATLAEWDGQPPASTGQLDGVAVELVDGRDGRFYAKIDESGAWESLAAVVVDGRPGVVAQARLLRSLE